MATSLWVYGMEVSVHAHTAHQALLHPEQAELQRPLVTNSGVRILVASWASAAKVSTSTQAASKQ